MNRPRRPFHAPPRRRPSGPPAATPGGPPQPRRRTPLDFVPTTLEPKLKVLGTGVERQTLMSSANPLELAVIHGYTREIEEAAQKFPGRMEDFWGKNPKLVEPLRKLDEVLAGIQARRAAK